MSQFTRGHALLIGVGHYANWAQLDVPVVEADAEQLGEVLCDPRRCGYPRAQVTVLSNERASHSGIVAALETLASRVGPDDTVTLFYAGHGLYGADGDYYLTTHDSDFSDKKVAPGTGLRDADFLARLRAIKAKRLLLLVNACHAGAIGPTLGEAEAEPEFLSAGLPPAATAAILATGEGRIIITAARATQKALVGSGPLTVFAQAVVDGLSGGGFVANNRGYISAFALYEQIYQQVQAVASRVHHQQEPELTVLKGVGPFPVALYRGATSLGVFDDNEPLPTDLAASAVERTVAERMWRRYERNLTASNSGSGAIAQGENAVAAGERGVGVGGDVNESSIVTGDNNTVQQARGRNVAQAGAGGSATVKDQSSHSVFDQRGQRVGGKQTNIAGGVNTGGGLFNSGDINTGGDFVGRDKKGSGDVVQGDKVGGDKTTTGDIAGSGVAIGRGAAVNAQRGSAASEIAQLLAPVVALAQAAPVEKRAAALETVAALQAEAAKGKQEDDAVLAGLIEDLVGLVPGAVSVVVGAFAAPLLAGVAGPVTRHVLRRLGLR